MTRWTPNWSMILRDLPPATHASVRAAVETARAAYFAVEEDEAHAEQGRLWREIVDYATSRKIQGFCDLVAQLPPDCPEAIALHALASNLNQVRKKAWARAVLFQHESRKGAVLHDCPACVDECRRQPRSDGKRARRALCARCLRGHLATPAQRCGGQESDRTRTRATPRFRIAPWPGTRLPRIPKHAST